MLEEILLRILKNATNIRKNVKDHVFSEKKETGLKCSIRALYSENRHFLD